MRFKPFWRECSRAIPGDMMNISNYGFIVKAPGYTPEEHRQTMNSDQFQTTIVGVSTVEQACVEAVKLAEAGIQVVELCGGFGEEAAQEVIKAVAGRAPVGFVCFTKDQGDQLSARLQAAG